MEIAFSLPWSAISVLVKKSGWWRVCICITWSIHLSAGEQGGRSGSVPDPDNSPDMWGRRVAKGQAEEADGIIHVKLCILRDMIVTTPYRLSYRDFSGCGYTPSLSMSVTLMLPRCLLPFFFRWWPTPQQTQCREIYEQFSFVSVQN